MSHILQSPIQIQGRNGNRYTISALTKEAAETNASDLTKIHNLIPHVNWTSEDLLAEQSKDGCVYRHKWDLSLLVHHEGRAIGFLIAYVRDATDRHPMQSVYVHRMAISESHQRNWVGRQLTSLAISLYFKGLPWLLTTSLQTNDEDSNYHVLRFYEGIGFRRCYRIRYPDKVDWLMEIQRDEYPHSGYIIPGFPQHRVPGYGREDVRKLADPFYGRGLDGPPAVYFLSGSHEKRVQYGHLMRCYGMVLCRPTYVIDLMEPQVEGAGSPAESSLVTAPLKLYSRWAALSGTYPLVVEDTMLFIQHFNRDYASHPILPGPDTKRWWGALGAEGLLDVMQGANDRRARYVCQLGVALPGREYRYVRQELEGEISESVRLCDDAIKAFPYSNATFFHRVFVPNGAQRTLAEMDSSEFVLYDYRRRCLEKTIPIILSGKHPSAQLTLYPDM